jgi:hypothetical protein
MAGVDKKTVEENATEVFLPKGNDIEFLGKKITVKPLPISIAKELRRSSEEVGKLFDKLGRAEGGPSAEDAANIDVKASELFTQAAQRLLQFYGHTFTIEDIEKSTLTEIKEFIQHQLDVQGEEDFLLAPLRSSMKVFFSPRKTV